MKSIAPVAKLYQTHTLLLTLTQAETLNLKQTHFILECYIYWNQCTSRHIKRCKIKKNRMLPATSMEDSACGFGAERHLTFMKAGHQNCFCAFRLKTFSIGIQFLCGPFWILHALTHPHSHWDVFVCVFTFCVLYFFFVVSCTSSFRTIASDAK